MATTTKNEGYRAITRFLIVSPYKIRPVANLVRRKPYPEAVSLLENMPHKGARLIRKTMVSAASNALNRDKQLVEDMLYIKDIRIDDGPRMKRIWIRGRGRADMLLRRMCHVTVVVDQAVNKTAGEAKGKLAKGKQTPSKKAEK